MPTSRTDPSLSIRFTRGTFTVMVSVCPPRWTWIGVGPPAGWIASIMSCQVGVGFPLTERTLSPAFSPATSAGLSAFAGQGALSASWVVASRAQDVSPTTGWVGSRFGRPIVTDIRYSTMNPSMKCVIDPADMTTVRFQVLNRHIARGASSGVTSSSAVMPAMSQNPPSGIHLTPYSVSPRRNEKIVGPKPMK